MTTSLDFSRMVNWQARVSALLDRGDATLVSADLSGFSAAGVDADASAPRATVSGSARARALSVRGVPLAPTTAPVLVSALGAAPDTDLLELPLSVGRFAQHRAWFAALMGPLDPPRPLLLWAHHGGDGGTRVPASFYVGGAAWPTPPDPPAGACALAPAPGAGPLFGEVSAVLLPGVGTALEWRIFGAAFGRAVGRATVAAEDVDLLKIGFAAASDDNPLRPLWARVVGTGPRPDASASAPAAPPADRGSGSSPLLATLDPGGFSSSQGAEDAQVAVAGRADAYRRGWSSGSLRAFEVTVGRPWRPGDFWVAWDFGRLMRFARFDLQGCVGPDGAPCSLGSFRLEVSASGTEWAPVSGFAERAVAQALFGDDTASYELPEGLAARRVRLVALSAPEGASALGGRFGLWGAAVEPVAPRYELIPLDAASPNDPSPGQPGCSVRRDVVTELRPQRAAAQGGHGTAPGSLPGPGFGAGGGSAGYGASRADSLGSGFGASGFAYALCTTGELFASEVGVPQVLAVPGGADVRIVLMGGGSGGMAGTGSESGGFAVRPGGRAGEFRAFEFRAPDQGGTLELYAGDGGLVGRNGGESRAVWLDADGAAARTYAARGGRARFEPRWAFLPSEAGAVGAEGGGGGGAGVVVRSGGGTVPCGAPATGADGGPGLGHGAGGGGGGGSGALGFAYALAEDEDWFGAGAGAAATFRLSGPTPSVRVVLMGGGGGGGVPERTVGRLGPGDGFQAGGGAGVLRAWDVPGPFAAGDTLTFEVGAGGAAGEPGGRTTCLLPDGTALEAPGGGSGLGNWGEGGWGSCPGGGGSTWLSGSVPSRAAPGCSATATLRAYVAGQGFEAVQRALEGGGAAAPKRLFFAAGRGGPAGVGGGGAGGVRAFRDGEPVGPDRGFGAGGGPGEAEGAPGMAYLWSATHEELVVGATTLAWPEAGPVRAVLVGGGAGGAAGGGGGGSGRILAAWLGSVEAGERLVVAVGAGGAAGGGSGGATTVTRGAGVVSSLEARGGGPGPMGASAGGLAPPDGAELVPPVPTHWPDGTRVAPHSGQAAWLFYCGSDGGFGGYKAADGTPGTLVGAMGEAAFAEALAFANHWAPPAQAPAAPAVTYRGGWPNVAVTDTEYSFVAAAGPGGGPADQFVLWKSESYDLETWTPWEAVCSSTDGLLGAVCPLRSVGYRRFRVGAANALGASEALWEGPVVSAADGLGESVPGVPEVEAQAPVADPSTGLGSVQLAVSQTAGAEVASFRLWYRTRPASGGTASAWVRYGSAPPYVAYGSLAGPRALPRAGLPVVAPPTASFQIQLKAAGVSPGGALGAAWTGPWFDPPFAVGFRRCARGQVAWSRFRRAGPTAASSFYVTVGDVAASGACTLAVASEWGSRYAYAATAGVLMDDYGIATPSGCPLSAVSVSADGSVMWATVGTGLRGTGAREALARTEAVDMPSVVFPPAAPVVRVAAAGDLSWVLEASAGSADPVDAWACSVRAGPSGVWVPQAGAGPRWVLVGGSAAPWLEYRVVASNAAGPSAASSGAVTTLGLTVLAARTAKTRTHVTYAVNAVLPAASLRVAQFALEYREVGAAAWLDGAGLGCAPSADGLFALPPLVRGGPSLEVRVTAALGSLDSWGPLRGEATVAVPPPPDPLPPPRVLATLDAGRWYFELRPGLGGTSEPTSYLFAYAGPGGPGGTAELPASLGGTAHIRVVDSGWIGFVAVAVDADASSSPEASGVVSSLPLQMVAVAVPGAARVRLQALPPVPGIVPSVYALEYRSGAKWLSASGWAGCAPNASGAFVVDAPARPMRVVATYRSTCTLAGVWEPGPDVPGPPAVSPAYEYAGSSWLLSFAPGPGPAPSYYAVRTRAVGTDAWSEPRTVVAGLVLVRSAAAGPIEYRVVAGNVNGEGPETAGTAAQSSARACLSDGTFVGGPAAPPLELDFTPLGPDGTGMVEVRSAGQVVSTYSVAAGAAAGDYRCALDAPSASVRAVAHDGRALVGEFGLGGAGRPPLALFRRADWEGDTGPLPAAPPSVFVRLDGDGYYNVAAAPGEGDGGTPMLLWALYVRPAGAEGADWELVSTEAV